MAASVNDKFSKVSTGVRPTTTTVASIRSVAGTSLICDDLTGWDTDAAVHFSTYQLDGQGDVVAGTQTDMKGTVSGNTISNIIITGGTDTGNAVGDIVQQLPTARYAKDLADGLLVSHDQDGTLKAGAVDNSAAVANDVIDSQHYVAGSIDTEHYATGSVTSAKTTATTYVANVTTSGTVASSTYANFPTNRCYVDVVTTIANAKVLVAYSADTAYASATGSAQLKFTLTNANTGNATYERRAQNSDASQRVPVAYTEIITLANAGTTRIEMQLRGSSTAACVAENVVLTAQVLQG